MSDTEQTFYPEYLKQKACWILWRLEAVKGRTTKVPYNANNLHRASSTDASTWTTYDRANEAYMKNIGAFQGIGIATSKELGIIFIDIDHCVSEDGELNETAQDIVNALPDQYIEFSQSGTGLHLLVLGTIDRNFKNSSNGVEMYDHSRFCAMTGRAYNASEPHECITGMTYVFDAYRTPEPVKMHHRESDPSIKLDWDDSSIINTASRNRKFKLLYEGKWEEVGFSSHSEADMSLCIILAFWCERDFDTIDRLFRSSGLYREDKWERADYRTSTIEKACGQLKESRLEYKERMKNERYRHFIEQ